MPMDGVKTDSAVRQFWDKYIILLGKQAIKPAQQRWFVRHAETYIAHYAEHKLATHSPEQVTQYLHVLGRQKRLKDWQFIQAVRAIRTLFRDLVQVDWANGFDWDHWIDSAHTLSPDHATLARENGHPGSDLPPEAGEGSLLKIITAQHPKWVQRLITEIRRRDYSIRTVGLSPGYVCYCASLALAIRFRLIPDSAASIAKCRCTSGGTRTINLPLYFFTEIGSGILSLFLVMSFTVDLTRERIPFNAVSGLDWSQLKPGNSAHSPTNSWSSSDHKTR